MERYLFWLGADAEAIAAQCATDTQRAMESAPVIDLTDGQADE